MKLTKQIQKAINLASKLHLGQIRKGDGDLPYSSHPFSVAWILSSYTDNEDVIVAGLLHDALEDVAGYSYEDLERDFGAAVAVIVKGVSEDKNPLMTTDEKATWLKRKKAYLASLRSGTEEALLVSGADKIHNLQSMREAYQEQGEALWERFNSPADKKLWFYEEVAKILREKLSNPIVSELEYEIALLKMAMDPKVEKVHPEAVIHLNDDGSCQIEPDGYLEMMKIVEEILSKGKVEKKPTFFVLTGPIGAGKTRLRREQYEKDFVVLDAGEIYLRLTNDGQIEMPDLAQRMALIGEMISAQAIQSKKNLLIEVLIDQEEPIMSITAGMADLGYKNQVVYVENTVEKSWQNNLSRSAHNFSAFYSQKLTMSWLTSYLRDNNI